MARKKVSKAIKTPYVPTDAEQKALDTLSVRKAKRSPSPSLVISKKLDDTQCVSLDHPDQNTAIKLIMESIGTTDKQFFDLFIKQLINAGTQGRDCDGEGPNFMLSVVKSIEPQDEIEALLAAQMAAVHMATMTFVRRLAHVESIPQQDSAEKTLNKLTRTFTTQMDALKKYRDAPQQRVHVEHVHVNEGGQAIVGNVKGGGKKNED